MICCSGLFLAEALDPSKSPGFSFLCVAAVGFYISISAELIKQMSVYLKESIMSKLFLGDFVVIAAHKNCGGCCNVCAAVRLVQCRWLFHPHLCVAPSNFRVSFAVVPLVFSA